MKYILVQFQRDKGKEFAGKYYIYKYDENKIKDSFVSGDVINELINSFGYIYNNAAIVMKVFDSYKEYVELQIFNDEEAFNDNEIKELTHISLCKRMFRVGDKVKIHKPKNINEWPNWISSMDVFDNKIGTVTAVMPFNSHEYYCYIDYESLSFNTNWLERIEDQQSDSINPGDWVIIHKPKSTSKFPGWIGEMDQYDNTLQLVKNVYSSYEETLFSINYSDFRFNVNWAEKYKEPNLEVGDIVIIHEPKNENDHIYAYWESEMDCFDQKIGVIKKIHTGIGTSNSPLSYELNISNEHYFLGPWLEKLEQLPIDFESNALDTIYSSLDTKKYQNPLSLGDYAADAFKEVLSICQERDNKNKESEGNNMDFSKMLNVEFGKITNTTEVAACLYGVAIRGSDGRYRAYDKSNSKIVDVTGMTFNTDMLFKVPCAISQIGVGDVIVNAGNYVTVTNVHNDGTFTVVDPKASEQKIAIPAKNMFGFDFMTKIFYPLDNFFKPTGDNPFGLNPMAMMLLASGDNMDMSTLALMTMMGNGITDQSMMLPMILMLNQGKTSNSDSANQDKNNKSDFMNFFALMTMMMTGKMGKANETKTPSDKEKELKEEIEKYRELEKKMKKVLDTEPVPEGIEPYTD